MKVEIKERKKNPVLDRRLIEGTVEHAGEATPSSEALKGFLAEELDSEEESIEIKKIFTIRGMQKSKFWAREHGDIEASEEAEKGEKKEESGGKNYEEVLGGSISDAKDEIEEMDDPDYEKLMEVEKNNKDRKGMKKYLEKNIGE
ncbi:MAG: hypothetical protein ACLFQ8_02060 [Candidatus Aenigmatarchaeota archaeon]